MNACEQEEEETGGVGWGEGGYEAREVGWCEGALRRKERGEGCQYRRETGTQAQAQAQADRHAAGQGLCSHIMIRIRLGELQVSA